MRQTRVLIYGDSLLLAGVRAILEQRPAVEILAPTPKLNARGASAAPEVQQPFPDIVLFDTATTNITAMFIAFCHIAGLRFIGLDRGGQYALVVQGQMHPIMLSDDLTHLILGNRSAHAETPAS